MKASDENVYVAGKDNRISKFNKDLEYVNSVVLDSQIFCGVTVNKKIICGMYNN